MKSIFNFLNLSFLVVILYGNSLLAQNFTDSNLPIVVIETDIGSDGQPMEIPDDPRVFGTMTIIYKKDAVRNSLSDIDNQDAIDYKGRISIEVRGSSSQLLPKKSYGFSTRSEDDQKNDNVSLLDMPKENDWILNSFPFDQSMMRDYISYQMARGMGQYAPRLVYCEVMINGNYQGLYVISERIKQDSNRVNISNLSDEDLTFPDITGGYILKNDKPENNIVAWSSGGVDWIHHDPSPSNILDAQSNYIKSIVESMQSRQTNSNIATGFPSVIDVPTFVDYMLMSEIASNVDSYKFSTYYHKDKRGKLRAGPIWDYNFTFGNDLTLFNFDRSLTNVWQFDNGDNVGAPFWKSFFNNSEFRCYLSKRFAELTADGEALSFSYVSNLIDETQELIAEAVVRENQHWNTIEDFEGELREIKSWLQSRITWMSRNLGDATSCSNITPPPLAITKIHYNPEETDTFDDSDEQEFIEVQNIGAEEVDLTGIYFSKLGFSYQFPAGATMEPGQRIYIAANAEIFEQFHGIEPFGEFSRDLSNKEQQIVLADAFGNIIDEVTYRDKSPWPEEADGEGSWLELVSSNADNSKGENWIASKTMLLSTDQVKSEQVSFSLYPNPSGDQITITSKELIKHIQIAMLTGQVILDRKVYKSNLQIPIYDFAAGLYVMTITTVNSDQEIVKRFVKK